MILSKVRQLRFAKEEREGRKLTYEVLTEETGLSPSTLARLLKREPVDRIDGSTLSTLCAYFGCGVGDVLEYVPDPNIEPRYGRRGDGDAAHSLPAPANRQRLGVATESGSSEERG